MEKGHERARAVDPHWIGATGDEISMMTEPGKVLEDIARKGARGLQGGVHQIQEGMRSIEKQTGEESQPTNPYLHGRIAPVDNSIDGLIGYTGYGVVVTKNLKSQCAAVCIDETGLQLSGVRVLESVPGVRIKQKARDGQGV